MKFFIPCFLTTEGDITEGTLEKAGSVGEMKYCQDLLLRSGGVFVKRVTFFFSWLIYVTVGKQPPEQAVPPLSTININMCTGPLAPASPCVNEA